MSILHNQCKSQPTQFYLYTNLYIHKIIFWTARRMIFLRRRHWTLLWKLQCDRIWWRFWSRDAAWWTFRSRILPLHISTSEKHFDNSCGHGNLFIPPLGLFDSKTFHGKFRGLSSYDCFSMGRSYLYKWINPIKKRYKFFCTTFLWNFFI